MGALLGVNNWVNWIPKGGCHRFGLGIYHYSSSGALGGKLLKHYFLFENPCLLMPGCRLMSLGIATIMLQLPGLPTLLINPGFIQTWR